MIPTSELEMEYELATARLAVAERYRFLVGVAVGLFLQQLLGNWWLSAVGFALGFWFTGYDLQRKQASAERILLSDASKQGDFPGDVGQEN